MTHEGSTSWYITKLTEVTPKQADEALTVVLTKAFAATWELPVSNIVLPKEGSDSGEESWGIDWTCSRFGYGGDGYGQGT